MDEEEKRFLCNIEDTFKLYIKKGPRSAAKVNCLHAYFKSEIERVIDGDYTCETEVSIKSCNSSGKKRCDVVLFKDKKPIAVFPVKFIMSNYKQNKNNSWENLTGELAHIKWVNKDIKIVPINIILNPSPYLKKGGVIAKFEEIDYEKSLRIYEELKKYELAHDVLSYIIDVKQHCCEKQKYDKCPQLLKFNTLTPHRSFKLIINDIKK